MLGNVREFENGHPDLSTSHPNRPPSPLVDAAHVFFRPVRGTLSIVPQESAHALTQPALCRQSNVRRNAGKTGGPPNIVVRLTAPPSETAPDAGRTARNVSGVLLPVAMRVCRVEKLPVFSPLKHQLGAFRMTKDR
jgi:hypothetical protein